LSHFGVISETDFGASQTILKKAGMAELKIEVAFEFGGINQYGVGGKGFQFGGLVRIQPYAAIKHAEKKMGQRFRPGGEKTEVMVVRVSQEAIDPSTGGMVDIGTDSFE